MITTPLDELDTALAADAVRIDVAGNTATLYFAGDALPVPAPTPLPDLLRATAAAIDAHAARLRNHVVEGLSPAEMASWPLKLAEARAFHAGGNPDDAPMLAIEAAVRGVPLAGIVVRVLANATALAHLEASIAGTAGRHKDAIQALPDAAAVLAYDWRTGWPALP